MKIIILAVLLVTYAEAGVIWSNSISDDQITLEASVDTSFEAQKENSFEATNDFDENKIYSNENNEDDYSIESRSKKDLTFFSKYY